MPASTDPRRNIPQLTAESPIAVSPLRHVEIGRKEGARLVKLLKVTGITQGAVLMTGGTITRGRLGAYLSILGLTLTNPATIISFTVVFV